MQQALEVIEGTDGVVTSSDPQASRMGSPCQAKTGGQGN